MPGHSRKYQEAVQRIVAAVLAEGNSAWATEILRNAQRPTGSSEWPQDR
jgi:hypothetical protein